jgi:eukaryotic-like serine/threonine-protein kinase
VAVFLAAALVVAVLLSRHAAGGSSGQASPTTTPASTTPAARTPAPSTPRATATPGRVVPAGFHRSAGPRGASAAVPNGWTRQFLSADSVRWTQPATGAHIQIDAIPWNVDDPVAHWRQFEREVMAKNTLPGFREIRLSDRFEPRGWPASDLEYTWSTRDHGTLRAYDRGFTAGGRQYALLVAAPAGRWGRYTGLVDTIYGSFQPG